MANYRPYNPSSHTYSATASLPNQQSSSTHHGTSNSMSNTTTLTDIETTRSDMRDILWQNAELLQSDPNYRKKVWRYMSKVFYGNQGTSYIYDNYKNIELPLVSNSNNMNINNRGRPVQRNNNNNLNISSSTMTQSSLTLLLDRIETYNDFLITSSPSQVIIMHNVRNKMENILRAYAVANGNKFQLSGAVQLCAVILTTFNASKKDNNNNIAIDNNNNVDNTSTSTSNNSDCQDTFFILQILTQIMSKYYENDEKLMKDETLLLLDVLCVNEPKLVKKLNSLDIDVIDLSIFVSSWIRCLFVHHFEIEFIQRVIDLVLLEGPSVLIAIVYGILQFIKNDILQCDTHYDVFERLAGNKLKNYLKKHEFINRVIQKAQLLFTEENYKYVIKGREKKSWTDLLGLPGQKHFKIAKGIGDKTKVKKAYNHWRRESRKVINSAYLGADISSDESDDNYDNDNTHNRIGSGINGISGISGISPLINDNSLNDNNMTIDDQLKDLQQQLQAAKLEIQRLKDNNNNNNNHSTHNSHSQSATIPENDQLGSSSPPLSSNNNDVSPFSSSNTVISPSNSKSKHTKSQATLSDILYTSQMGDTIYKEPITDNLQPREIQCRTENWTDSWKNAINSLTDASVSMQGYLCKMTASKWNSRGTLDKIQRRWFVLRGNFMTYYKTHLHTQPKSDKCVNLIGYKVNPVIHLKSKFAFELISPPKENLHKKNKNKKKYDPSSASPNDKQFYERTKFVLIPDSDLNETKQRSIRDKWVKSLRLATKGPFLWDVLLNIVVEDPLQYNQNISDPNSPHQHQHQHQQQHHNVSQTAFVNSHHGHHSGPNLHHSTHHSNHSNHNYHHHHHHNHHPHISQNSGNNIISPKVKLKTKSKSSKLLSDNNNNNNKNNNNSNNNNSSNDIFSYNTRTHHSYQHRQTQQKKRNIGGNTADYPDYNTKYHKKQSHNSYPYVSKSQQNK